MRLRLLLLVVLVAAGCGSSATSPSSVARTYEQAIVSRDGDRLCGTFAPKLREVLAERAGDSTRFNCGAFFHALIGYPHENTDRQFVSGKLLELGQLREVRRRGRIYVGVPARLRFEFTYTGYSSHRDGDKGSASVADLVWLEKAKDGSWGVVKPSLALTAASSPDVLFLDGAGASTNAAPPDPEYSQNEAERSAAEAADYRDSFRRRVEHAPLHCSGRAVTVGDSLRDAVTYPTGSALHPAPAPRGNDIAHVRVSAAGHRICVAVTFRRRPRSPLRIDFRGRSHKVFLPEYVVEFDPDRGVRGGGMTNGYRSFRGGTQLSRNRVAQISLYGKTVEFTADTRGPGYETSGVPADLTWGLNTSSRTGSDQVPDAAPTAYVLIRQRDGHRVRPGG